MKCVIIANGDIVDYEEIGKLINDCDFIVCADGGAKHLLHMDILPHTIVGDLDSIDESAKKFFKDRNVDFYRFPKKKDYTDTELAIKYALKKGVTEILFLGVIGSRMDHTIANITLLLPLLKKNIQAKIINDHNEIMIVDKEIAIAGEIGEVLSIIPLTQKVEGITLQGLEYPLYDATISMGQTIGISNKFIDKRAVVSIKKGKILLIKARD
ncbi:thiamine diphosphokinase [Marinisporobacter balticus]|uniref:Thiamine diphosphokinase n=1 Tax=Marinisporobacter balticus TaxID=2018667 RepID=A0A4R2L546_9FIRM|nr:thiamine diphosphokinase [Marinisporobacter balticus]TCO78986.1 thiamine pyrophosphokinase [Marinisporobacter balticus]